MDNHNNYHMMLRLEPLDLLLFREGRPFGVSAKVTSGLPNPQTIAGALRSAMLNATGISLELLGKNIRSGMCFKSSVKEAVRESNDGNEEDVAVGSVQFRGPWFGYSESSETESILFPLPATLKKISNSDGFVRLDPLEMDIPGWDPKSQGMKPLWSRENEKFDSGTYYLNFEEMSKFLNGDVPSNGVKAEDLYNFVDRTGIAIDDKSLATTESMIYSANMLSLKCHTCLLVELIGSADILDKIFGDEQFIPLGGEGRYVKVKKVNQERNFIRNLQYLQNPSIVNGDKDGDLIVLTTPAILNSWRPKEFTPLSAAVLGYEAISGWDMARKGHKPNQFAVPAGTVYYLKQGNDISPESGLQLEQDKHTELGWGCYLKGKWKYA